MYINFATILQVVHMLWTVLLTALVARQIWLIAHQPVKRDLRLSKLEADQEDLLGRIQKLAGRMGRQKQLDAKEEAAAGDNDSAKRKPGESDFEWKKRARGLVARGVIKHET